MLFRKEPDLLPPAHLGTWGLGRGPELVTPLSVLVGLRFDWQSSHVVLSAGPSEIHTELQPYLSHIEMNTRNKLWLEDLGSWFTVLFPGGEGETLGIFLIYLLSPRFRCCLVVAVD